jgi:hypothetical protein
VLVTRWVTIENPGYVGEPQFLQTAFEQMRADGWIQ